MLEADIYCDSTRIFILTVLFFISVRPFNITVKKKVNDTYEQVLKHLHLVVIESRKKKAIILSHSAFGKYAFISFKSL